jgi:hypothetical protein
LDLADVDAIVVQHVPPCEEHFPSDAG